MAAHSPSAPVIQPVLPDQPQTAWAPWLRELAFAINLVGTKLVAIDAEVAAEQAARASAEAPWTAYTPTVTAASGTFTTVSAAGRYKVIGKTCFVQITVSITTNGSAASWVGVTVPFATPAGSSQCLSGREVAIAGYSICGQIGASTSLAVVVKYDATYPGGNGAGLVLGGAYEIA